MNPLGIHSSAALFFRDVQLSIESQTDQEATLLQAVDNLVKPESNSDASQPDYQQLKAVENPVVAGTFRVFGNGLAPEMKTARSASP